MPCTVHAAGMCTGPGPCDTSPLGTGKNWVTKVGGLPAYIRAVAHAFRRQGLSESEAIQRAIGVVKNWAEGKGNVTAATRAKAAAAIAEWEAKKARAHAAASTGGHMADREGIELARVGEWELATGPLTVTPEMLVNAAERAQTAGPNFRAPIKLGHVDPRFDGEPALGWLHNLRVEGAGDATVLKGDVTGMPKWLADLEPTAYPDRSVEGLVHAGADGAHGFEITALALLGVTPPGMTTIRSLRDLPAALGVTDQPMPVAAAFKASHDAPTPELTAEEIAALDQTPAEPPVAPPTPKEADAMSDTVIKGLRERLGIADDAELDDAGVLAAVDQALAERAEPTPEVPAVPEGSVVINGDALEELRIAAAAGQEARAVQLRMERDTTISTAIAAGKIAPARKDHWATNWDKDPEGTKTAISELEAVFPIAAAGHTGSDVSGVDYTDDMAAEDAAVFGLPKEELAR